MFRWPTGHALPGDVPAVAAVHLLGHWGPLPHGWLHLPLPDKDRDEARRQPDRQAGAADDEDRLLQWPLHPACDRSPGLSLLRVLQPGRVDGAVAQGHLQPLLHALSSATAGPREGAQAHLRGVHGKVRVFDVGGGDEQCLVVEWEDGHQLEEVHREVTGKGPGQAAEGHRLRVEGDGRLRCD